VEPQVNERWLQFGFINAKGNVTRTALKIPFHANLYVDQEIPINILGQIYAFTCVREETVSNNSDTVDKVYVVATNHQ
jgi:hypothetical protein